MLGAALANADYLAYSLEGDDRIPLPENIDGLDAKHLVNLEWGGYDGAKSRLGVLEVENNSDSSSFGRRGSAYGWTYGDAGKVPVSGIETIVTDALNRSGRFRLVERTVIQSILEEQDFAASGRVARPSGAATGNVLGAQYLVQVVVTDYEARTAGSGTGVGGFLKKRVPALGDIDFRKGQGRVGLNFRLIDAATSEVTYTKQIESVIKESGISVRAAGSSSSADLGGFLADYSRTPIGQAVIAGINKGVYELVKQIGAAPASGSIVKAENNRVFLNIGGDSIRVGDEAVVVAPGEELIDPETGISLGSSETEVARVRVAQVQDKFSIADVVSSSGRIQRGYKVRSLAAPPSIEFAPSFGKQKRGFLRR